MQPDTSPTAPKEVGLPVLIGVSLVLVAFWSLVWKSSLDGAFHFDDFSSIVRNNRVRRLWPLDSFLRSSRPLGSFSFALNYHFSGLRTFDFHLVNLAIHLCNGLLLFVGCILTPLLYRARWLGETRPVLHGTVILIASLIATCWTVHPLTTQAVTYIVQRYESLASLGYLGIWVGTLFFLRGNRVFGAVMVGVFAWIGVMSKEIVATAPIVVLLFDRMISRDDWASIFKSRWLVYGLLLLPFVWFVPHVLPSLAPGQVDASATSAPAVGFSMKSVSAWEYLRTQPEVLLHYVSLVAWPSKLCLDYGWRIQSNPLVYVPLGLVILVALVTGGVLFWRGAIRRNAFLPAVTGWLVITFFLILAPTSSFFPIRDLAFEHRMYLACAVPIAGAVLALQAWYTRLIKRANRPTVLRIGFALIVLTVITMLAWRTHHRNLQYRSGLALWQNVVDVSPENPRAWYNLGREYYQLGRREEALRPMVNAVGMSDPSVPMYDAGLADCLRHAGRIDDAVTLYERALAKMPRYPEVLNNLGVVRLEQERDEEAERLFRAAADLHHLDAVYNLGVLYQRQGRRPEALECFEIALQRDPTLHQAALRLAQLLITSNADADVARAKRLLSEHVDLRTTRSVQLLRLAAEIESMQGNLTDAIPFLTSAIDIESGKPEPDRNLINEMRLRITEFGLRLESSQ